MTDRTFVDTNVLVAATTPARAEHAAALAALHDGFSGRTLVLSGQVVREYLSVATRPAAQNGLGLPHPAALTNVRAFLDRALCLDEDARVREAFFTLLAAVPCLGKQVHDANIAATMIAHRIPRILTLNGADFLRFSVWVSVVSPLSR